ADMAVPKYKIATGERLAAPQVERPSMLRCLHIGVARAGDPRRFAGDLHEPRAVDAEAGATAPEVGRADEGEAHVEETLRPSFDSPGVIGDDKAAAPQR